jgi:hypothetical protein
LRSYTSVLVPAVAGALLLVAAPGALAARPETRPVVHADPVEHGVVHPRRAAGTAASRTNMTYHGGRVMTTAHIHPIFWGTSWPTAAGDKITGIDSFYAGWGGSGYARTNIEYTDSTGTHVGSSATVTASVVDPTAATGGATTAPILAEVAKMITANKVAQPEADGNAYYPVYTDVPRGNAGFCAWHSSGTVNGRLVEFAFFFRLDGDAGCDPADPGTTHSQGLEAIANVTAHELAEALTDPAGPGAWYDRSGNENGDKCAWAFSGTQTLTNGSVWKLQGEWSNAAFSAGRGLPNLSGQKGCLYTA